MNEAIHSTDALLAQVAWLRALALELVQDGGEAEDLAQETILRALEHPPRAAGAMRSFLRRVSKNILLDRARGESRRRDRERRVAREEAQPATDDLVDRLAAHRQLVEAVDHLDEPYRTTLLLRFFDGLPPRAIAARLRTPVKTVNTRLQRGLERLRADLDRGAEGDRRRWVLVLVPLVRGAENAVPTPTMRSSPAPRSWRSFAAPLTVAAAVIAILVFVWSLSPAQEPARTSVAASNTATDPATSIALLDGPREATGREPIVSTESAAIAEKLVGRVMTTNGQPIPGAHVLAQFRPAASFDVREGTFERSAIEIAEVAAAADGRFDIDLSGDASHRSFRLVARAPGFGTETRDNVLAGDVVVFELGRAGRFEFTVVTREGGTPCAGAQLALSRTGVQGRIFDGETDADGRRTIGDLAPGVYLIEATPRDAERVFAIDLVLGEGEHVSHVLRANPGGAVEGRVSSTAERRPIAGARVHVGQDREVITDALGCFKLAGLSRSQASVTLVVEATGFAPLSFPHDPRAQSAERIELELKPEARVRGRLIDAHGAPAAAAWIIVDDREARSESDGSFVVRGITPDRVRLVVFARHVGSATLAMLLPAGLAAGDTELGVVRLAPAASVAGRVRTLDGRPIANARVTLVAKSPLDLVGTGSQFTVVGLEKPAATDAQLTTMVAVDSFGRDSRKRSVRTNSAGRFQVFDLAAGHYRVAAQAPGSAGSAPVELELSAGESRTNLDLSVADGLTIAGRVRGTDGESIVGAWIVPIDSMGKRGGVNDLSAVDGSFELRGLAPGSYDIDVSFHGLVAGRAYARNLVRGLVPPLREVDVRLSPLAFIEGVLVDDAGHPIADVYVGSTDEQGRRVSSETDEHGRFRIGAVEGATVVLAVQGPVIRSAREAEQSKSVPRWKGELAGVAAGAVGIVLHASREE